MSRKVLAVVALCFLSVPLAASAQPAKAVHAESWLSAAVKVVLWFWPSGWKLEGGLAAHCGIDPNGTSCPPPPAQVDGGCSVDPNGCPKP